MLFGVRQSDCITLCYRASAHTYITLFGVLRWSVQSNRIILHNTAGQVWNLWICECVLDESVHLLEVMLAASSITAISQ